jgi:hydrogenase-4 component B
LSILLGSIIILFLSGLAALAAGKSFTWSTGLGAGGTILACLAGFYPALYCLLTGETDVLSLPWNMPFGSFLVTLDPLSALFLLPLLLLSALAAFYGARYLKAEKEAHAVGSHWFFFNLLIAGMIMVLSARNGLLFLIAWEGMSLAPFFLVIFEDHRASARKAAWT